MPRMTKRQFDALFHEEILPHVIARYEQDGVPDRPARREAWNETVDEYIRDRRLPACAGNWPHPRWLETWVPPRRHHATMARGKRRSPAQLDREINAALTGRTRELREMEEMLARAGFAPSHARQLQEEGMGAHELAERLRTPSGWGSLQHSHGFHKASKSAHATKRTPQAQAQVTYVVQGNYGFGHGWEDLTAEETREGVLARLREYRENEPGVPFRWVRRRERAPRAGHARKKKMDPREVKQRLRAAGIDFTSDFHALPRSAVQLILDAAREAGYRKRRDAPGSTARMYFQYLSRLR